MSVTFLRRIIIRLLTAMKHDLGVHCLKWKQLVAMMADTSKEQGSSSHGMMNVSVVAGTTWKCKERRCMLQCTCLLGLKIPQFLCVEKKSQLDATEWFIALIICSTCFGHFYAHHQELETICVLLPPMVCSAWLLVVGGQVQGSRLRV